MEKTDTLSAYFPFTFRSNIDPRKIFTVGEQVLVEHLFAMNSNITLKKGFNSLFAEIKTDYQNNILSIQYNRDVYNALGDKIGLKELCENLKNAISDSRHVPYLSLLDRVECLETEKKIIMHLKHIPVNIHYLFTLPDFSLFAPSAQFSNIEQNTNVTGPYVLHKIENNVYHLKLNKFYPKELRANSFEEVSITKYNPSESTNLINNLNIQTHSAVYFYGHSIENEDLERIKNKNFTTEVYPDEWLIYLITQKHLPNRLINALRESMEAYKKNLVLKSSLGSITNTLTPLAEKLKFPADTNSSNEEVDYSIKFTLTTPKSWSEMPGFKKIIKHLTTDFPNMNLNLIDQDKIMNLFSSEIDVSLSLLGLSPNDPISHLSFLEDTLANFNKLITKEDIIKLATMRDLNLFNQTLIQYEKKIKEENLIIPIAHFPGIVAYRSDYSINDDLSLNWGIQLWSFQKNSVK